MPVPALRTAGRDFGIELSAQVRKFVDGEFTAWMTSQFAKPASEVAKLGRVGLRYALIVVYPSSEEEHYRITLRSGGLESIEVGGAFDADITLRITASGLLRWVSGEIPYYSAYFEARSYSRLYRLMQSDDGRFLFKT